MSSQNASDFDPYLQNITILSSDGTNIVQNNVSLQTIDSDAYYTASVSINYGTQIGASLMMLILLLLLTRREKRKSPTFWLNATSLLLVFISRILLSVFFFSNYNTFYALYTSDFQYVTRGDKATQLTSSVFPLFITFTINTSLVLQAKTVVHNVGVSARYFRLIIGISLCVLLNAVIFRTILTAEIMSAILEKENFLDRQWLIKGSLAAEMITVWWFCFVFSGKLIMVLRTRRAKKWTRQASMEVLVIGTFYTMFLPGVFTIVNCIDPDNFHEAGSLAITMIALFLPLTSLWASAAPNVNDAKILPAKDLWGGPSTGSRTCSCGGCHCSTSGSGGMSTTGMMSTPRRGSAAPLNHQSRRPSARTPDELDDFDLEKMDERDIRVIHSYGVQSDAKAPVRPERAGPSGL